jgi:Cu2+-exporting ATPase
MSNLRCDHCLLAFPESLAVRDEVAGQQKVFCCNGCRGIYLLIHSEGLDEFYAKRSGWLPGRPEEADVTSGAFTDSIRISGDEAELDFTISGIRCASCIWLIEHFLMKAGGIKQVSVNYATHKAKVRWIYEKISVDSLLNRVKALGYTPRPSVASDLEERLKEEKRDLLVRFGTASFLAMQIMLFTTALYAGYFQGIEPLYRKVFELIALGLSTPVIFYCGYPFLKNTIRGIRNRTLNMDTLVFTGSFSAYLYSVIAIVKGGEVYFDTSVMIITLILLGRFIESGAKAKATGAVSSLIGLQPKTARLIGKSSGEKYVNPVDVPVSSLAAGDHIEVIPGDKVPVDCIVIEGSSEIDEAMLTGESMPVGKMEGAEVFAGTLNLNGRLVLEVRRTGNETVLAQITRAVEDAQSRKAPIQKLADRVVGWFVPAIILIAAVTFISWFARGIPPTSSLMNAISVLVIACPCALGLATPLAILIGSTLLSSKGILAKGGDIIETLARSDFVCFDKTGTLTMGRPRLIETVNYGLEKEAVRLLAASLEKNSEHTVAKALRSGIRESDIRPVGGFKAHPGMGVEGTIDGEHLLAGNIAFLESFDVKITDEQRKDFSAFSSRGNAVTGFAVKHKLEGWFVIADDLRPDAPAVVDALIRLGCKVGLLTGDHRTVAEEVGRRAGISMIDAEVLPVGKAVRIREIKESGHRVIMVGDGINDAPALIEADAGVAIGSATDIAMESADVVLMRNDLNLVPRLIRVSRKILAVIRENLFWAFSYNLIAIPLAVSGKIHPIVSAAFMVISSLIVVGNSLRLYRVK